MSINGSPSGGALDGIRVIELSSAISGPLASRVLGDYGADVIKIEPPDGDILRRSAPSRSDDMSALFLHLNRNKRAVSVDLKQPAAQDIVRRLIAQSDVFMHNMRPSALERLGLSYDACRSANPTIIFAGIAGYGARGSKAGRPVYDDLIQADSGLVSLFEQSGGEPRYIPLYLIDRMTGMVAAQAICAALVSRSRTGHGQSLEIPMFETMAELVLADHLQAATFEASEAVGNARLLSPYRRPYKTADGLISIFPSTDKQWNTFFSVSGCAETYGKDSRFANAAARSAASEELLRVLSAIICQRKTQEWLDLLLKADVPCAPVQEIAGLAEDEHLQKAGFIERLEHPTEGEIATIDFAVSMSETPYRLRRHAPKLAADTADVLEEFGFSSNEIKGFVEIGLVQLPLAR